jgi:sigma-B regulation protein RsbU (phosphoserine phosphatase)
MVKFIGFTASISAFFLFQEFYGKEWGTSFKWLISSYGATLLGVVYLAAEHNRFRSIPSPGITLVVLIPVMLLTDRFAGYRPPQIRGRRVIFIGLTLFFLTFAHDRLANFQTGEYRAISEPFGFFILTICLGYVVSMRVAANEAEWISMAEEMRAARKIQAALLPLSTPLINNWAVAARYAPMTAVAGDFYGFPHTQGDSMEVILADVMGHGVPAALIASMVKVSVFAAADKREGPDGIMGSLNDTLCREAPGEFVTAVYISLNRQQAVGSYSAAGHPPPLLWRRTAQTLQALDHAGLLLGVRDKELFVASDFTFDCGDRLLLYSDGLTEAENEAGQSFGEITLPSLFPSRQSFTVEQFADSLLQDVLAWSADDSGPRQADDITFVVIDL